MICPVACPVFSEPGEINVTSPFQPARIDPIDGQVKRHDGVDLTRWIGYSTLATICSLADGTVCKVGFDSSRGNNVSVSHGNGWVSMYFHLADGSIWVKVGQKVKERANIGYMGNTGHSAGAHLHFQLEKYGVPVDGLPYLLGEKSIREEEDEMIRYRYLSDIPNGDGFRDIISRLMDADIIRGDGSDPDGNGDVIDLSHDQVRSLVYEYRGGAFDRQFAAKGMRTVVPDTAVT